MNKHSPGPWLSVGADGFCMSIWDAKAETVCEFKEPPDMADVRLLRAAPELLEACKAALLHLDVMSGEGVPGVREFLVAAIAKAEGK